MNHVTFPGTPRTRVCGLLLLATLVGVGSALAPSPYPDDPSCTPKDRAFMARAYELADAAGSKGNSSYGALLVKDGAVLLEFENDARTSGDVTHHAETGLISVASRKLGREALAGTILYTSNEPCIMCCGSIRAAGIPTFV
jgi:tRNA(Arg) A34 adenosine deaminase TadA